MKKLFSVGYSSWAFNLALVILRVGCGILMINHGYDKLVHFQQYSATFMNFLGLGGSVSLALVVFAEFLCSIFLILGLFTRLATIPLIIDMAVAVAEGHDMKIFSDGEHAAIFFLVFVAILLVGPGKVSVDGMINK
jgi:putative oxidoreductase